MIQADFEVCVIGAGPAGLAFAQRWVEDPGRGALLLVEAGQAPGSRACTVQHFRGCRKVEPCHVTTGIGGASGLAGGKLSEYPAGRGLSVLMGDHVQRELAASLQRLESFIPLIRPELEQERLRKATRQLSELSYELRHYQANKYAQPDIIRAWESIMGEITARGGQVLTGTRAVDVRTPVEGHVVRLVGATGEREIRARAVIITTGRTGAELIDGLRIEHAQHPLDVGVRIEFPASCWPDLDAVHGDLKLHFDDARTFCTSKAGWISPYRYQDFMLLEGRTDSSVASKWSNLAITVRCDLPAGQVMAEIRSALRARGPGSSIRQPLDDFLAGVVIPRSTREPEASFSYWRWGDVNALLPATISDRLREAVRRFASEVLPPAAAQAAHVFGPEVDYYWSTIPHRNSRPGLWAAGDVTGAYRGILQAYAAGRFLVKEVERYLESDTSVPA